MWIAGDYLSSAAAFFVFSLVRYHTGNHGGFGTLQAFLTHTPVMLEQILFPLFIVALSAIAGSYQNLLRKSYLQEASVTFILSAAATCVFFFVALIDDTHDDRFISYKLIHKNGRKYGKFCRSCLQVRSMRTEWMRYFVW